MPIYQGDRVTIKITWRDKDKNLIDPSTHNIKIYDSEETLKHEDTTPDRHLSVGVFEEDYDIPLDAPTGIWRWEWLATIAGGGSKLKKGRFRVA